MGAGSILTYWYSSWLHTFCQVYSVREMHRANIKSGSCRGFANILGVSTLCAWRKKRLRLLMQGPWPLHNWQPHQQPLPPWHGGTLTSRLPIAKRLGISSQRNGSASSNGWMHLPWELLVQVAWWTQAYLGIVKTCLWAFLRRLLASWY